MHLTGRAVNVVGTSCRILSAGWLMLILLIPYLTEGSYMTPLFATRYLALTCAVLGALSASRRWIAFCFWGVVIVILAISFIRPR
jgi:hypothetical protein